MNRLFIWFMQKTMTEDGRLKTWYVLLLFLILAITSLLVVDGSAYKFIQYIKGM